MQERSSCSVSSASHQFCTLWLQLTPSTWHAGCRIVQRPFRWLAEEQSRLWNRLLRASAIGPGHLLDVGTKDQAVGRLRATSAELGSITAFLRPYSAENTYPVARSTQWSATPMETASTALEKVCGGNAPRSGVARGLFH